jgi:hypothetical protein
MAINGLVADTEKTGQKGKASVAFQGIALLPCDGGKQAVELA